MKIIHARPPNFEAIAAVFPFVRTATTVIFTYGDTIFNPGGFDIDKPLLAHEQVHSTRHGSAPDAWWARYLRDEGFRFEEELLAHREEWRVAQEVLLTRPERRRRLKDIVACLSGPLYNRMCTQAEAKGLLRLP